MNATTNQLRGQFDKLLREKSDLCLKHDSRTDAWFDVYYSHPSPKQIIGFGKKVAKLEKTNPDLFAAMKPLLVRMTDCASEFARVDAAEKQAKADRKAAIAAKKADKEAKKLNPYLGLNEAVAKVLREVAEPYRVKAVAQFLETETNLIHFLRQQTVLNPEVMFPITKEDNDFKAIIQNEKRRNAMRYLDKKGTFWKLLPNLERIALAKAEKDAEEIVNAFVQKVGAKLSGIVDKKGDLESTSISGSLQSHWMTFKFADKAEFQVQSQIVWKTSVNGVHFAQYPTCFRNVKLSTGSKMELPSESKMKEAFV